MFRAKGQQCGARDPPKVSVFEFPRVKHVHGCRSAFLSIAEGAIERFFGGARIRADP